MYRPIFIIMLLITFTSLSALAVEPTGSGWVPSHGPGAPEAPGSTFTGKLKHNSADADGSAPYVLLDKWGTVRSYVTPSSDVVLEPYLGQQITLQGRAKAARGGGLPLLQAEQIVLEPGAKPAPPRAASPPGRQPNAQPYARQQPRQQSARPQGVTQTGYQQATRQPPARRYPSRQAQHQDAISDSPPDQLTPMPAGEANPVAPAPSHATMGPPPGNGRYYGPESGPMPAGDCGVACGPYEDCGPACQPCAPCGTCDPCGCGAGIWARTDYLLWSTRGSFVPALITTGSTGDTRPGALDQPGTQILFGNERINDEMRSGGRVLGGLWLDDCQTLGIQAEYLGLVNRITRFSRASDGDPILARPFFNTGPNNQGEDAELVAFPRENTGSADGLVEIEALTRFQAAAAELVFAGCRSNYCDPCAPCGKSYRSNFLLGYRFLRLDDRLGIATVATLTNPGDLGVATDPARIAEFDQFDTNNQFHGGELGLEMEWRRACWSLQVVPKVSLGSTHEEVTINGGTRTTLVDGSHEEAVGGTLALPAPAGSTRVGNIGTFSRNEFAVVPEIGATIGYQLTPKLRATVGYSFIYWSRVARAGNQIDPQVNATLLPGRGSVATGDLTHPAFAFHDTSFWAQGVNFGLDFRW